MSGQACMTTLVAAAGAALLAGCFADGTGSSSGGSGGVGYESSSGSSSGAGPSQPIVADVDTNGTLIATQGQGIGVYVEYEAGGHWALSWTCDTLVTHLSCSFVVDVSVSPTGMIQNPLAVNPSAGDSLTQPSAQQIQAVTTTTSGTDGVTFDAAPGALVTVSVQLNAPVSFFFVQDNKVNGGYSGPLTNPIIFKPSTP